ncbi:hypothetical protein D9Q98_010341 [Chlorella vulgaris]|uniref:Peptidase S8/S53 domain-containing protein n=1 Tax=Chlorella vulgaris TaxID=3077 RepID=A0A9D4TK40_CHLVU|nr:hypothetical protein D9Q98_010341 [Chlorella vulgaris]
MLFASCAAWLLLLALAHAPCTLGTPVGPKPPRRPLGLIIKLKDDAVFMSAAGTAEFKPVAPALGLYKVKITDGQTPEAKAAQIRKQTGVEYVVADEWVHLPRVAKAADDQYTIAQWSLPRINAPKAWAYKTDSSSVPVCVVDTGVKFDHPDLAGNLAPMPASWVASNTDDNGHGTHVAGIIGAVGNNRLGVSGVSWKASILVCKALDSYGDGTISDVVECLDWCTSKGARVINTSFEMQTVNLALKNAIGAATAAGIFFAAAAGNTAYQSIGNNNDVSPRYPASFDFPGNVAVANLNINNVIDRTSNFGGTTVHVAAPGTSIVSTSLFPDWNNYSEYYVRKTGTSMAAPCVASAAALAIAMSGGALTNVQVAKLLVQTSTPLPALKGKVVANGVINLEQLVIAAKGYRRAAG